MHWFLFSNHSHSRDKKKQEESSTWAKRVIDVASITEDADSITEMHQAVFEKKFFAVDSPDGEHDLEDVVRDLHLSFALLSIL